MRFGISIDIRPQEILLEKIKVVDALVTSPTNKIDCTLLLRAERLRIIAQYAVGYDNIDIECATRLSISLRTLLIS